MKCTQDGLQPAGGHEFHRSQSGFMPESFITFAHFGISDLMAAANSAGELPMTSSPRSANLARTSANGSTLTVSRWSLRTIVAGVAAGASRPNHGVASKPWNPDPSMVGNSGT